VQVLVLVLQEPAAAAGTAPVSQRREGSYQNSSSSRKVV
jgi:hypothetical protein